MVENPNCPICLDNTANVAHALWSCNSAQDVWGLCSWRFQKSITEEKLFREVLEFFFNMSQEELEEFAVTAQQIWRGRNILVFEGKFLQLNSNTAHVLAKSALEISEDSI